MLFSVFSTTVAFALEESGAQQTEGGTSGNTEQSNGSDSVLGSFDAEWVKISYTDTTLKVELYPEIDALTGTNKDQIKDAFQILVDAINTIAIDKIKDSILDDAFGGTDMDGSVDNMDALWEMGINNFVKKHFGESDNAYLTFVEEALADETVVDDFVTYVCDLLRTAVKLEMITLEELPEASEIRDDVLKVLNDKMNEQIDAKVTEYVGKYLSWITCETDTTPDLPANVLSFINEELSSYITTAVENYLNGNSASNEAERIIFNAIDDEIEGFALDVAQKYLDGVAAEDAAEQTFFDYIDREVLARLNEIADKYLAGEAAVGEDEIKFYEFVDGEVEAYITNIGNKYLSGELAEPGSDEEEFFSYVDSKIEAYIGEIATKYLNGDAAVTDIEKEFYRYADNKIKDYISDISDNYLANLQASNSDEEKFFAYIDGKVQDYIDEVVEKYLANTETTDANELEFYSYVDTELKAFIDEEVHYFIIAHLIENGNTEVELPDGYQAHEKMVTLIEQEFDTLVNDAFTDYFDYRYNPTLPIPYFYGEVDKAIKEVIGENSSIYNDINALKNEIMVNDQVKDLYSVKLFDILADEYEHHPDKHNEIVDNLVDSVKTDHRDILSEQVHKYLDLAEAKSKIFGDAKLHAILESEVNSYLNLETAKAEILANEDLKDIYNAKINSYLNASAVKAELENDVELKEVYNSKINEYFTVSAVKAELENDAELKQIYNDKIRSYLTLENVKNEIKTDAELKYICNDLIVDYVDIASIKTAISEDAALKVQFENKVNEYLDANSAISTLRDLLKDLKNSEVAEDRQKYADICAEIEAEIAKYTDVKNKPEFLDKALEAVLGINKAELDEFISDSVDKLITGYSATKTDLESIDTELDIKDLIDYLQFIYINDHEVYGDVDGLKYFKTEAVKALLKEIPTLSEIKNFTDTEMKDMIPDYTFKIVTDFADCEFTVDVVIGGGYETIRTVAEIILDHLSISVDGNKLVVDLHVPAKFAQLVLRAAESGKIPDDVKQKVFAALSKTGDDVYALYNELTIDDLYKLIDAIELDKILDSDYLAKYIDTKDLSAADVKAKIEQYASYINKLKSYGVRAFEYIPDEYMNLSLMDFYKNGTFSVDKSFTISYWDLEEKLMAAAGKVSSKLESYVPIILSYIDLGDSITAGIDLDITVEDVYKIEYFKVEDGKEVLVRRGFLPVGADIAFFSGIDNTSILGWVDANGVKYDEMPRNDTKLYAVYDKEFAVNRSPDVDATYNGSTHNVFVEVVGCSENAILTYSWTKDGAAISYTGSSFTVKDVNDSGVYVCTVTIKDGLYNKTVTATINVNIEKATVNADGLEWVAEGATETEGVFYYTYNGSVQGISLKASDPDTLVAKLTFVLKNAEKIDASEYVAGVESVDYSAIDTDNYTVDVDSFLALTQKWEIKPMSLRVENVSWTLTGPQKYTGQEIETVVTSVPENMLLLGYTDNKGTEVGNYTAVATFGPANTNYVIEEGYNTATNNWSIYVDSVTVSGLSWTVNGSGTYDGSLQSAEINPASLPDGIVVSYVNDAQYTSEATNAGSYVAKAVLTHEVAGIEVIIADGSDTYNWSIAQKQVDLSAVGWNYTSPLAYVPTGNSVTIDRSTLPVITGLSFTISYANDSQYTNAATAVGAYTAKAVISISNNNYKLINAEPVLNWEIIKAEINLSNVAWNYTAPFDYQAGVTRYVGLLNLPSQVTATYDNNGYSNPGTYTTTATLVYDTACYTVVGFNAGPLTWVINRVSVDLSAVAWDYTTPFTYDGFVKKVNLVGVPEFIDVTVVNGEMTLPGTLTAVATISYDSDFYDVYGFSVQPLEWTVNKLTLDLKDVKWNYEEPFVYDGQLKRVELVNLPEGVVAEYYDNEMTLPRTIIASVKLVYDERIYDLINFTDYELTWSVTKLTLDLSEVKWDYTGPYYYNGEEYTVGLVNLPKEIMVDYENNKMTRPGTLLAKAKLSYNEQIYNVINNNVTDLLWQIDRLYVDVSTFEWDYTNAFTYDGAEHSVTLSNVPSFVKVTYTGNVATNAGKYVAMATVKCDEELYELSATYISGVEWIINKAALDVSGLVFDDLEAVYDGFKKIVEVKGLDTLPECITVTYSEYPTAIGVHTVTATFADSTGNYIVPEPLTATVTILTNVVNDYDFSFGDIVYIESVNGIPDDNKLAVEIVTNRYPTPFTLSDGTTATVEAAYDISFLKGGQVQSHTGTFNVMLLIPENLISKDNLGVIHIADNGTVTLMDAFRSADNKYMIFSTEHFSVYAVVELTEKSGGAITPAPTLDMSLIIPIAIALAVIILIIIIVVIIKKRRNDDFSFTPSFVPSYATTKPVLPKFDSGIFGDDVNDSSAGCDEPLYFDNISHDSLTD